MIRIPPIDDKMQVKFLVYDGLDCIKKNKNQVAI